MKENKVLEEQLSLGDDILNRIVQIVQEGFLMGIDITDLMRQIRVTSWDDGTEKLHLSAAYRTQVKEGHSKMVAQAEALAKNKVSNLLLPSDDSDGSN